MAQDKKQVGIANLIRSAGHRSKSTDKNSKAGLLTTTKSGREIRIFDILTYIEAPWGLNMTLYPVQRFIVKLYYNLPLDEVLPENVNRQIRVSDMFNSKILYTFTEKEYLHYLFNEGRCNIKEQDHMRRQLTLPIGRRAGKCKSPKSLVVTSKGLLELSELGDVSGPEWQPLTITVAQAGGRQAQSSHFYNNGVSQTRKVKLRCGIEDESTPNHRVMVLSKDGVVDWKCMGDVQVGDYVAVSRGTDLWPTAMFPVPKTNLWSLPDVVDEDFGLFLGYLVGDGTWGQASYLELTGLEAQVRRFSQIASKVLGHPGRCYPAVGSENGWRWRFDGVGVGLNGPAREVRGILHNLGFNLDVERDKKRIPFCIRRSPKSVVCAFLRGLFETDGCSEGGGRIITLSSSSFELAREVQLLLLNLGVVTHIGSKWNVKCKKHYAILSIRGAESRAIFCEQIGFDSDRKQGPLLEKVAQQKVRADNKSDTEAIPNQFDWLQSLLGLIPKRNASAGKPGWGRSLLRQELGNAIKPGSSEDLSYPRLRKALVVARNLGAEGPVVDHFEELLRLNYFYDPIVSIEEGEAQVYDLTVPDGEAFVANGMVNHNTTLSAIFASYELYRLLSLHDPQEYYGLPNGNRIQIISVATDKDQAGLLFNDVTAHMAKCEFFKPYIANNTLSYVQLRTPSDIEKYGPTNRTTDGKFTSFNGKASIRVTFKASISKGLRGAGNVVIILDEMAHFQANGSSSAKDIYDAITPSAAAFSQKDLNTGLPINGSETESEARIIGISSPLNKAGKFYELFHLGMSRGEGSENMLVIQAPTWEVNPTVPTSYYRAKYHEDPTVFMTEHGALFSDRVRGWIEREQDLTSCIRSDLRPRSYGPVRYPHQMGLDVGMVGDGTTVAITHCEGQNVILDYHEAWYAGVSWKESNPHLTAPLVDYAKMLETVERLDFDEIANWIVTLSKKFYLTSGIFDRWNGLPLEQALHKKGLKQFKSEFFTRDDRSRMFQAMKLMLFDHRIVLYDWPITADGKAKHSPLIEELLSLQATQMAKNQILVEAPKILGAHDDVSDALVRAVWLSLEQVSNQKSTARPEGSSSLARGSSLQGYQVRRARNHGVLLDRNVRGLRRR